MKLLMSVQLSAANIVFAGVVIACGMSAKASDRTVYVLRPPWRSAADISDDIARVGGHLVASATIPYATKATLPSADALKRLVEIRPGLILTSSPTPMCSKDSRSRH